MKKFRPKYGNQKSSDKNRCRRCGGYCVQVLVCYGSNSPVEEWECLSCHKSSPVKPNRERN